jgi:hypothetical protein
VGSNPARVEVDSILGGKIFWPKLCQNGDRDVDPGSMLWSQLSAIFDNFRRKNGVFLKKQRYDQNCHNLA